MTAELPSLIFQDIAQLIETAKRRLSQEFNLTHVMLSWHVENRIHEEILNHERAEYGKTIIKQLSKQLMTQYGQGYGRASLARMVKFAKLYPKKEQALTLSQQLNWTHIVKIISIDDPLKRDFYIELYRIENWSTRTLINKIDSLTYERTALSKKPEALIQKEIQQVKHSSTLTPEFIFQDPCFLDFTGLKNTYSESDLESAILDELTRFIGELGNDFCFVDRQKRMSIEAKDRYLDLLFFHRGLKRLIAIELKVGPFEPAHKDQMEWYLNWLDKHERKNGEERPLGIILCADKDQEDIEYLALDDTGIHVAQYLTELPPKRILEEKLRQAILLKWREKNMRGWKFLKWMENLDFAYTVPLFSLNPRKSPLFFFSLWS